MNSSRSFGDSYNNHQQPLLAIPIVFSFEQPRMAMAAFTVLGIVIVAPVGAAASDNLALHIPLGVT